VESSTQRHVFISYVREDLRLVDRRYQELTMHGVTVWMDRESLRREVA
jgi:hypothetical protein